MIDKDALVRGMKWLGQSKDILWTGGEQTLNKTKTKSAHDRM